MDRFPNNDVEEKRAVGIRCPSDALNAGLVIWRGRRLLNTEPLHRHVAEKLIGHGDGRLHQHLALAGRGRARALLNESTNLTPINPEPTAAATSTNSLTANPRRRENGEDLGHCRFVDRSEKTGRRPSPAGRSGEAVISRRVALRIGWPSLCGSRLR